MKYDRPAPVCNPLLIKVGCPKCQEILSRIHKFEAKSEKIKAKSMIFGMGLKDVDLNKKIPSEIQLEFLKISKGNLSRNPLGI